MEWIITDYHNMLLIVCGAFYTLLFVFSIVTGLMYALGKRKLNPIELGEKTMARLDTEEKQNKFARQMG